MGAHGSKEKLSRSASDRFIHTQVLERERFGSFGKRTTKGSAKKRDVRTLSISPTDLGPPPKTQTNNATVRTKQQPVLAQKRISSNNSQPTTATPSPPPLVTSKQGSPPPKKVISRRPQVQQTHTKVPLKDHNRLLGHSQQQQQQQQQHSNNTNSPKSGIIHGIKTTTNASSTANTTPASAASSPPPAALVCAGLKAGNRNSLPQSPPPAGILHSNNSGGAPHTVVNPTSVVLQQQQIHKQKQQHPQVKSSKGLVDFHLVHANKGFEALGVLLQYLVYDLDAFSCPKIKNDYAKVKETLYETRRQLEEGKASYHDLQDQLHEKDLYYTTRESEIQTLHRCELEKVQTSLKELEGKAQERIRSLEAELISKDVTYDQKLKDYMQRTEAQLIEKDQELSLARDKEQELLKRISALSTTENELRERVTATEQSFAERLLDAAKREHELTEKVNALNKELELFKHQTESRERELEEKLNLSHDEISVLRNSRNLMEQSLSPKSSPTMANGNATKLQMLQEVESLRSVLELKQTELSDLRKQNHELKRASDDVPLLQMKVSALESRIEDLQIQLKAKSEEEKELIVRNKHLQESYKQELETRSRLSLHNEELQWRLKQNSEKFALALNELSKSYSEQSSNSFLNASKSSLHSTGNGESAHQISGGADQGNQLSSSHNSSLASLNRTNGSDRMVGCFQMDDVSPPASPIIKGVVEKNDSVSWVLEMDDETPEVLASRMIRRAGSFRSSFNEKSSNARRQYSLPAASSGNPLMQSASATSVIRQHSSESVASMHSSAPTTTNARIRSKSVTIKSSEPRKFNRQNSNGAESKSVNGGTSSSANQLSTWRDPICSSSPYRRHERSASLKHQLVSPTSAPTITFARRSSFSHDDEDGLYRKQSYEAPNLITCDTSALTAAENRLQIRSLPSHPSVQDLKVLKKCQEIQESAGEAMVSGTNSEDEGCSASSDDIISSASSADSATSSLDCNGAAGKHHVLSLEDALMNKMSTSLGGTPMEVSWSDDVDQFPSGESIV
ncbi:unnamed protein product [Hermetia illucens]|uniref:Uncharacterized protein n=1 Tax=Hermetia illucens TaxID=343691 RepID=A0A7R8YNV4_HERIL|nr:unnamed protein product [Hermetia illucens]